MLLVVLSPVMLLISLVIWAVLGRPVLFRQRRPGLHGRLFTLIKFRTMTNATDETGELLPDMERFNKIGHFIEKTSLDELPELFNVLKGEMSLVGPRPWLADYLGRYTPEQARRHDAKPGITGLAQVRGRRNLPFSKRIELDLYYVDHWSLWFDLKILLATIPRVLSRRGTVDTSVPKDDLALHDPAARISEDRWEYGSIFHWPPRNKTGQPADPHASLHGSFYGSGRDAMRVLMAHGMANRGWKRLWMPSYFCQAVTQALVSTGIQVRLYPHGPDDASLGFDRIETAPGDVVLRMNYFGMRSALPGDGLDRSQVEIIDDHSHDPWAQCARESDADWCVASLRKTLPIPDGGVLWSPREHELPPVPAVSGERRAASFEKMTAMVLKGMYLDGQPIDRELYRRLAASGEEQMGSGEPSAMPEWTADALGCFPVEAWREQRRANYRVVEQTLAHRTWLRLIIPDDDRVCCPFSGILVLESEEMRDRLQQEMAARKMFLPVLWPMDHLALPGVPEEQLQFSKCMLCVPCDMRYEEDAVGHVARMIREIGDRLTTGGLVKC